MTEARVRMPRLLREAESGGRRELREAGRLRPLALEAEMNLYPLSRAEMVLHERDLPLKIHDLVELYGLNGSLGVFRVTAIEREYGRKRRVRLSHGLDTLADAVLANGAAGGTLAEALGQALAAQNSVRWRLGTVEDAGTYDGSAAVESAGARTDLQSTTDASWLFGDEASASERQSGTSSSSSSSSEDEGTSLFSRSYDDDETAARSAISVMTADDTESAEDTEDAKDKDKDEESKDADSSDAADDSSIYYLDTNGSLYMFDYTSGQAIPTEVQKDVQFKTLYQTERYIVAVGKDQSVYIFNGGLKDGEKITG